jgi:hypothetical protein
VPAFAAPVNPKLEFYSVERAALIAVSEEMANKPPVVCLAI